MLRRRGRRGRTWMLWDDDEHNDEDEERVDDEKEGDGDNFYNGNDDDDEEEVYGDCDEDITIRMQFRELELKLATR